MTHFLEHLDGTSAAAELLEAIKEVLHSDGKLLILSPDYLYMGKYFFDVDFSHSFVTTKRRLEQILLSANYKIIQSDYMNGQFSGFAAACIGILFKLLPFYSLNGILSKNSTFGKLYKLKASFVRCVFVTAQRL
jgi:hypothetical protein